MQLLLHFPVPSRSERPGERLVSDSIASWVERIREGSPRALAQAITAVEDRTRESYELLRALFPYSGRARIVGLTGAPGSGKSTLTDQLAREYRKRQKSVGIVAVDPTSPFTGGAILGDRIRMQRHHADPGIYIRSMATRGSLGGLASTTADVASVLDASGRDVVLIETVGVGQDEVDIVRLADVTLVILVPGMGDDVQSIKAGIMEIADIFVVNKSDRDGADRVEREIRALQSTARPRGRPPEPVPQARVGPRRLSRPLPARAAASPNWLWPSRSMKLFLRGRTWAVTVASKTGARAWSRCCEPS